MKSRQKNWRESRSRETEVGKKIAVTNKYPHQSRITLPSLRYPVSQVKCERINYSSQKLVQAELSHLKYVQLKSVKLIQGFAINTISHIRLLRTLVTIDLPFENVKHYKPI